MNSTGPVWLRRVGMCLATILLMGVLHLSISGAATATPMPAPATCSAQKIGEVLARATAATPAVTIDCHLNLSSSDVVTKKMILAGPSATGVVVNCNNATLNGGEGTINYRQDMIVVKSREEGVSRDGASLWTRPEDITIHNCNIIGSVRIWGMGQNANAEEVTISSRKPGHVANVRNNAPTRITLDNLTITGVGRTPLYFAPGVTDSKLINSEIKGVAESVAVYFDAESSRNTIKNSYIHGDTPREQMAIDGSSYNTIIDNRFSGLDDGGIYLYRNCGEERTIRHSEPRGNQIINNVFYYNLYTGPNPSVYLGSRDGKTRAGNYGYCGDDRGYPYGSSVDDRDYARYNVVMQNQIYKRSVSDMIKTKNLALNSPNYIDHNETVTVAIERLAGCYVADGYKNFVLHGQSIDVIRRGNGEPACSVAKFTCNDGDLIASAASSCEVSKLSFDCQVSGNNNGCRKTIQCPSGKRIVGATAACNLESGAISDSTLATVPANIVKVFRASDSVSEGSCYVGSTSLQSGQEPIIGINDRNRVLVGCGEHDSNGGDCHIKGFLYCR